MITTTKDTLPERYSGILWQNLPLSFQDAITATAELGIRYLWIDSLCIVQDDATDWSEQSSKMAEIYANSYINIALTRLADGHSGCFSERFCEQEVELDHNTWICPVKSIEIDGSLEDLPLKVFARIPLTIAHKIFTTDIANRPTTYYPVDKPVKASVSAPLLTRAWVFQERYLAPRTVHFHASEMLWECTSMQRCECTGLDKLGAAMEQAKNSPASTRLKRLCAENENATLSEFQLLLLWKYTIAEYTTLRLTRDSDRLPALSGIALRFNKGLSSSERDPHYLAGLWNIDKTAFIAELLWEVHGYAQIQSPSTSRLCSPAPPSWSLASLCRVPIQSSTITLV